MMMQSLPPVSDLLEPDAPLTLTGVPDALEPAVLAELAMRAGEEGRALLCILHDGQRLAAVEEALSFFAPGLALESIPAWDTTPYDRASPNAEIMARRMAALARLARRPADSREPLIVLTTANALVQKVPARERVLAESHVLVPGNRIDMDELVRRLETDGFNRTATVRETGEYAVRGGILDLWSPGAEAPVRLDFFGDTLESIRPFDAETQRSTGQLKRLDLVPVSEVMLDAEAIRRFRQAYVAAFGAETRDDTLYGAVSEGRRHVGMEHWLAFFHESLDALFDYLPNAVVAFDHLADDAIANRLEEIADHYQARREALESDGDGGPPYKPAPPEGLYLDRAGIEARLAGRALVRLTPFRLPDGAPGRVLDIGGRQGRTFAAERAGGVNVFDAVIEHLAQVRESGRIPVIAAWSEGSRDRLAQVLSDHGLKRLTPVEHWAAVETLPKGSTGLAVLALETGFETDRVVVVGEQDILGDRLVRAARKRRRASDFLSDLSVLSEGDIVVHVDHGIGRFVGLRTIEAAGAPRDCLEIHYAGNDKLYLPVENIELLSRYGSEETDVQLDRLGGGAWQARKARLKQRIREMADRLIKVAAARAMKSAPVVSPPEGLYDEFCARFPYEETEDQLGAIDAVFEDLATGRPMDRLVCGDVGFGKTEVALRAAFATAMSGRQVAVVVPTTLLARQHFKTFSDRFRGLPLRIAHASRLVPAKELAATKAGLADGTIDIVVGTHALLSKSIAFRDLGLLIVDEEQHFGVAHKERLKELKADVHVLTLTATPIPRTLQLALTGVRELSLISTPPVDRLAVRTFVSPFDALTVREAILRERYRGGQVFFVCPRISDIAEMKDFLDRHVPEAKVAVAHGQMAATRLEDVMSAFYEGRYDVLLSTSIVESGLDVPTANTLIVHRADMFGLAQLYQLKGRVGRSKIRAYALFTVPPDRTLTAQAERRLKVLQSLEGLGAGFQLASHDLDIRGAGNLLGEEQSGHIREVGYELYQQMLEEAVASLRSGEEALEDGQWSPQITVGTPVLIPEDYVPDLSLRLSLYRRLGDLVEPEEIDAFAAEMVDRFGPLPDEVEHLMKIVFIKGLCRKAGVEKIEAGPKGVVIAFRNNVFANPEGLIHYIAEQGSLARVRPDQRVVISRDWATPEDRLKGTAVILSRLARIAGEAREAA